MSDFFGKLGKFLLYGKFGICTFIYICFLIIALYIIIGKKYNKYTATVISVESTIINGSKKYNISLSINNEIQTFTNRKDVPKNIKKGDVIEVYMISTELYFENPTKTMILTLVAITILYILFAFIFYKAKNDEMFHAVYGVNTLFNGLFNSLRRW